MYDIYIDSIYIHISQQLNILLYVDETHSRYKLAKHKLHQFQNDNNSNLQANNQLSNSTKQCHYLSSYHISRHFYTFAISSDKMVHEQNLSVGAHCFGSKILLRSRLQCLYMP